MEIPLENLLSVSVCRVVPRDNKVDSFVGVAEYEHYFSETSFDNVHLDEEYRDKWIVLPKAYENVYLGESVSFYVSCVNDSTQDAMTTVSIQMDLQIGKNVVRLKECNLPVLEAKARIIELLSFEVKDLNPHMLIITLAFNVPNHEPQMTRKYFKYNVAKPIDVKTKSYVTEYDEVYLEALFQNLTQLPIQLTKVQLESEKFDVTSSHNFMPDGEAEKKWIFGTINRLDPYETRQYLFILKPKTVSNKAATRIGKLDILWYSGVGIRGHIQTSPLESSNSSSSTIKIIIDEIPKEIYTRRIFAMKFRLINNGVQPIQPILHFVNSEQENVLWLGLASKTFDKQLEPDENVQIEVKLFPTKKGLHNIPLIKVQDLLSRDCYDHKELAFVNII